MPLPKHLRFCCVAYVCHCACVIVGGLWIMLGFQRCKFYESSITNTVVLFSYLNVVLVVVTTE